MEPTPEDPPQPVDEPGERAPKQGRRPLPTWLRVSLIAIAVLLVAIGIAGLVLPGLQGIVTILAGLALLSLVSRQTHWLLRRSLQPWPRIRKRVERLRRRLRGWLHRKLGRVDQAAGETAEDTVEAVTTDGDEAEGEERANEERRERQTARAEHDEPTG